MLVNIGDGRGKSTSAFGAILRMLGRKKTVALIQFLKHEGGQWGEVRALRRLGLEANKPRRQHLLISGRNAPRALIDYADTVSEMVKIKHAFDAGIKARAGIEF